MPLPPGPAPPLDADGGEWDEHKVVSWDADSGRHCLAPVVPAPAVADCSSRRVTSAGLPPVFAGLGDAANLAAALGGIPPGSKWVSLSPLADGQLQQYPPATQAYLAGCSAAAGKLRAAMDAQWAADGAMLDTMMGIVRKPLAEPPPVADGPQRLKIKLKLPAGMAAAARRPAAAVGNGSSSPCGMALLLAAAAGVESPVQGGGKGCSDAMETDEDTSRSNTADEEESMDDEDDEMMDGAYDDDADDGDDEAHAAAAAATLSSVLQRAQRPMRRSSTGGQQQQQPISLVSLLDAQPAPALGAAGGSSFLGLMGPHSEDAPTADAGAAVVAEAGNGFLAMLSGDGGGGSVEPGSVGVGEAGSGLVAEARWGLGNGLAAAAAEAEGVRPAEGRAAVAADDSRRRVCLLQAATAARSAAAGAWCGIGHGLHAAKCGGRN
jgi:hypothetical protein